MVKISCNKEINELVSTNLELLKEAWDEYFGE